MSRLRVPLLLACSVLLVASCSRRGSSGGGGSDDDDAGDDDDSADDDDATDDDDASDDDDVEGTYGNLSIGVRDGDGFLLGLGSCDLVGTATAPDAWDLTSVACRGVGSPEPEFNEVLEFDAWTAASEGAGASASVTVRGWELEIRQNDLNQYQPSEDDRGDVDGVFVDFERAEFTRVEGIETMLWMSLTIDFTAR